MEDVPFAAGIQIIDADHYVNGIRRVYSSQGASSNFDSLELVESAFSKLTSHGQRN